LTLLKAYRQTLRLKTAQVKKFLSEITYSHLCMNIMPTVLEQGFRNRAKFKIFGNPRKFEVKGTDPLSGEIPASEAIWILPGWGRKLVSDTIGVISQNLSGYWVDGFEVQLTHGNKHAHLILFVKRSKRRSYAELADLLLAKIPSLKGVSIPSQKSDFGEPYLLHAIRGKNIFSHHDAFFQSNIQLTPRLLEDVQKKSQKISFRRIIDLFCGVGLFSLFLTKNDTEIIGVDNSKKAIESARRNADYQGIGRASFICSSVETYTHRARLFPDDFVLIDPPRSGCASSLIETIASHRPHSVCSISCCLKTHIRDLKDWIKRGYSIQSFSAFDMFPFTEFLETVALLAKKP